MTTFDKGVGAVKLTISPVYIRPRKINVLFQVQNFSKLNARTRKNYKKIQNYKFVFPPSNMDLQCIYGNIEYTLGMKKKYILFSC